ncbi:MAG: type I restriction endonuclease, partial [Erysipelothrix sp.]
MTKIKIELQNLVDKYEKSRYFCIDKSNNYNELSCRNEFIDPFLNLLGWDVSNSKGKSPQFREVIVEKNINKSDRPDYSLTLNGVIKLFVEAKKPSVKIENDNEPAFQIRRYGWNAGHSVGILTNFEYLVIYDTTNTPKITDSSNVSRYKKYHYTEYISKFDEIYTIFSREAVYSGNFDLNVNDKFIKSTRDAITIDEYFLSQINNWRVDIGNSLYKNKKYKNIGLINDVTQEFINQLVFLRICDDRYLPLYHRLFESAEDELKIQPKLLKLLAETDKIYNSGLFKNSSLVHDLDPSLLYKIISDLYYPNSPYLFNIIEPHILGRIYENFLTQRLVSNGDEIILNTRREYVDKSIVTTPQEIVKYMVTSSLDELCKYKTPKQILELRIADISCGSGIFLESSFDYLVQYVTNWYSKNNPSYLITGDNGERKLPFGDKKEILTKCIYGVDIDIHAVEVARFSLLVKLVDNETESSVFGNNPILPDLGINIQSGNSLVSNDHTKCISSIDTKISINAFDWTNINDGEKFNLIIGNPPYVSTEGMVNLLPEEEVEIYRKKYKSSLKQFDKYYIFIEKGVQLLQKGGILNYIVPNKFSSIESGEALREFITANNLLMEYNDFGSNQLFSKKIVYSSILVLSNKKNSEFTFASIHSPTALWSDEKVDRIKYRKEDISNKPWRLTSDKPLIKLMLSLSKFGVKINTFVDFVNGIQTSAERPPAYWFSDSEVKSETDSTCLVVRNNKEYSIEKNILKPYFKPTKKKEKNNSSFDKLSTNKRIIFPYDSEGKLIPIETMNSEYPGALEFLEANYAQLVPKQV